MTQFFALREDMLPVLAKIESKGPLRYALADRFQDDILLYGSVATTPWSNEAAKKLRTRFQSVIRKHFQRIGGYYVAAAALEMLKGGKRLTTAQQSPKEFDLSLDSAK